MIIIPDTVYKRFLQFALENAPPHDRSNWKECIGLVLGKIDNELMRVTDIIPIGSGTSVFVDITDYEKVFSLIPPSKFEQGEVIIGWAHTHPGLGLFFSGTDSKTQLLYQRMHPKAFGLVLDPTAISSTKSGFKIFRVDDLGRDYYAVDYQMDPIFDFQEVKREIISQLALFPALPPSPQRISNTEISWKNIRVMVRGPTLIRKNQLFKAALVLKTTLNQFIRLQYRIKITGKIQSVVPLKDYNQNQIVHETISQGTLAIIQFIAKDSGFSSIILTDVKITDYTQELQKSPDLVLNLEVQE
ncbi:Mov34/MPN/PAD-1 family protein [Candidatus Hodarchaeum mangrovi]